MSMYVEGLEADLNEKNPINTVGFILQVKNGLMYSNRVLILLWALKSSK